MPTVVPKSMPSILQLKDCEVFDEKGSAVPIFQLWQKQTCIFIFLRHFACIGCRGPALQIWGQREQYEKGGARLVFIGNGSPDFVRKFKEDLKIHDAPVFTDPSLASFRAAGFKRGFLVAMGVTSIANGLDLMYRTGVGTSVSKEAGDLWQLGGVVVVKPSGEIPYHYISEALGDYPPESDIKGE